MEGTWSPSDSEALFGRFSAAVEESGLSMPHFAEIESGCYLVSIDGGIFQREPFAVAFSMVRPGPLPGSNRTSFMWRGEFDVLRSRGVRILLIGWEPLSDTLVNFDAERLSPSVGQVRYRIRTSELNRGKEEGIYRVVRHDPRSPTVYTFRGECLDQALLFLEGPLQESAIELSEDDRPYGAGMASPGERRKYLQFDLDPEFALPQHSPATPPEPKPPTVDTGFAVERRPEEWLPPTEVLDPGQDLLFCFGVGTGMDAIDVDPTALPEDVPAGAHLNVELLAFENELEVTGAAGGQLEVLPGRRVRVVEPAYEVDSGISDRTLFFPVRAPEVPGSARLRSNLYYGNTLIQSHLVIAQVGENSSPDGIALRTELDYHLVDDLGPDALADLPGHDLCVTINGGNLSHEISFYSGPGTERADRLSMSSASLVEYVDDARECLETVSWGQPTWNKQNSSYRYDPDRVDPAKFREDLARLAVCGRDFYTGIVSIELDQAEVEKALTAPGKIQVSMVQRDSYLPVGLFYSDPLTTGDFDPEDYKLCDEFEAQLDSGGDITSLKCFVNKCAQASDKHVVCPSGFWGFRHEIGWPVSASESTVSIDVQGSPRVVAGISTDPKFRRRAKHLRDLESLAEVEVVDDPAVFATEVMNPFPHLVYMFCHGGLARRTPYLRIGDLKKKTDPINGAFLSNENIEWKPDPPRPLVFLNGCHTNDLAPDKIMRLANAFVGYSNATGVIGTEIMVFESLACDFGDAFLGEFLAGRRSVGDAVRYARLQLLGQYNPLGLVYLPFVSADTRLVQSS